MAHESFKYAAFISYSHRDKSWADWLHRALETYRVPKRLIGRETRYGRVPARLVPIFRDRDELPTSADLGANISEALRASRHLIVICSPRAAVSRWVDEEIRTFKATGRESEALCIIVDGEPNATDKPDCGDLECFPQAIRFRVDATGRLTDQRTEPIAADARPVGDGRDAARLKLIAGMLGVGFDELRQREAQRRFWWRAKLAAATLAMLLVLGGIWSWQSGNRAIEAMQARSARLTELGRRELLEGRPVRAAALLERAYAMDTPSPALRLMLGQVMPVIDGLRATLPSPAGAFINEAALSADGSVAATWSAGGGALRAWHVASGRQLTPVDEEGAAILAVSLARNEVTLAAIDKDRRLIVRRGGQRRVVDQPGPISSARFDADTRRILTYAVMGHPEPERREWEIVLWDIEPGPPLAVLDQGIGYPASDGDYSPSTIFAEDGSFILTRVGTRVRVFDRNGVMLREFSIPVAGHVSLSPDGRRLVAPIESGIAILDMADGTEVMRFTTAGGLGAGSAEFSPDGGRLLVPASGRQVRVFDLAERKERFTLRFGTGGGASPRAAFAPDGQTIVMTAEHSVLSFWDAWNGTPLATIDAHEDTTQRAIFSADGASLLSLGENGTARVWATAGLLRSHFIPAQYADINASGTRIVTGGKDRPIELREPETGRNLGELSVAGLGFPSFGESEHTVVAVGPGRAMAWDAANGRLRSRFDPKRCVYDGKPEAIDRAGRLFVCELPSLDRNSDQGKALAIWDLERGEQLGEPALNWWMTRPTQFSPDGRFVVTDVRRQGFLTAELLYEIQSGKVVAEFRDPHPVGWNTSAFVFGPRDGYFVMLGKEAALRNAVGDSVARLTGDADGMRVAAFSADGAMLAIAGYHDKIWLFDGRTGAPKRTLIDRPSIRSLVLSADGARLLVMTEGHFARVYDTTSGALVASLEEPVVGKTFARFGPYGTVLMTWTVWGDEAAVVRFWDSASGKLLARFAWRPGSWGRLVWNPGRGLLVATEKGFVSVRDLGLENREWRHVADALKCRVPWRVEAEKLVPASRQGC